MKIKRIVFLVFFLVSVSSIMAAPAPPGPPGPPDPPLEGPINEDIPYLIVAGLILGTAVIYRNKIKKASV